MSQPPDDPRRPPTPLHYEPVRERRRGLRSWAAQFLARLSRPMPLGMYYVIMFALSAIALVLAVLIRLIVRAFAG